MLKKLFTLLFTPPYEEEDQARRAELVHVANLLLAVLALVSLALELLSAQPRWQIAALCASFSLVFAFNEFLLHKRQLQASSILLVSLVWLAATAAAFSSGGIMHPIVSLYFLIILLAGLVLGGWGALTVSTLTILAILELILAQRSGILIPRTVSLTGIWLVYSLIISLLTLIVLITNRRFRIILDRARIQQISLENSNRALQTMRSSLENRVAERTAAAEMRSRYLEAASEIARAAASILDTEQLMQRVVDLIRERFELYYAGLFLLDQSGDWAVLRSGTGQAGLDMLARGHRIRVGSGMVGWSIANARARIAQVALEDSQRLITPELPETRAEAALPLRSRGRVLGALTVQSTQPSAFDETTIALLQSMADQVAIAIDNARLFAESQEALEAVRRAYSSASRDAWDQMLRALPEWGYRFSNDTIQPASGEWSPEMVQAARQNSRVIGHQQQRSSLALPLRVREGVVGVIKFQKHEPGGAWSEQEISTLEALLEQIGEAVENARLYEQTQQRAERERLLAQVSSHMRQTLDLDAVLQTAVSDMARVFGLSEVVVQLVPQDGQSEAEE